MTNCKYCFQFRSFFFTSIFYITNGNSYFIFIQNLIFPFIDRMNSKRISNFLIHMQYYNSLLETLIVVIIFFLFFTYKWRYFINTLLWNWMVIIIYPCHQMIKQNIHICLFKGFENHICFVSMSYTG